MEQFSILFGLLRERSGSMWVAVLAHFGHNAAFAWIGSNLLVASDAVLVNEYLAGDTGLFVLLGTGLSLTGRRVPQEHSVRCVGFMAGSCLIG